MNLHNLPGSINSILLIAALALGGATFWGVTRHVEQRVATTQQALTNRYLPRPVLVAARDLAAGKVVTEDFVAVRQMPRAFIASDVLDPAGRNRVMGATLARSLRAGDPLTSASVVAPDRLPFSAQVAAGERAITVPVDEISAVGGLVQPGDRIDLLYSYDRPLDVDAPPGFRAAVRLLLADIAVLATGKATRTTPVQTADGRLQDLDTDYNTVTLRVTPQQAQIVTLAQRSGEVVAALRNRADAAPLQLAALDWRTLVEPGAMMRRVDPRHRFAGPWVELIVGGQGGAAASIRRVPLAAASIQR